MNRLNKGYTSGAHRLINPTQTLAKIKPHLSAMGITRCANVTGLDRIGIPVYCAIRPNGADLQVSNGKGINHQAAQVSALMEGVEIFHAENPGDNLRRDSLNSLRSSSQRFCNPQILPEYISELFWSDDFVIDWVQGKNLLTNEKVWLPASAAYDCTSRFSPLLYRLGTNGLASGNHLLEATLHALYEIIERDAISSLTVNGRFSLKNKTQFIDVNTIDDNFVAILTKKISQADFKLVLISVKSCIPINTFWAVLLDKKAESSFLKVNVGFGTHLSTSVAASRAITEAVQQRLTFIHGSRDDLSDSVYQVNKVHHQVYQYFDNIQGKTSWQTLSNLAGDDLRTDYNYVLKSLCQAGYHHIFQIDMTRQSFQIPVVKVLVPGMKKSDRLF